MLLVTTLTTGVYAQKGWSKNWFENLKLGGFVITEYQYKGQKDNESNEFTTRLVRLDFKGTIAKEFDFRVQAQLNGMPNSSSGPRIVDAYMEWTRFEFARIKVGQFKRAFSFENPMHPITVQNFYSTSQVISKLSGFSDRNGCHSSNGRDIGIQVQGDFLKINDRNILHYQAMVANGQGINTGDKDNRKDLIGEIWVSPIPGLRIGASGWTGSYSRNGSGTDENGNAISGTKTLSQNRYALSAEYASASDWTLRGEYLHGTGKAFKSSTESDITVNEALGDKADGWYVAAIAPIIKQTFHAKARYDVYRSMANWESSKNNYSVGLDYTFLKRVKLNLEYIYVNDRSADSNYSMVDCQLSVIF